MKCCQRFILHVHMNACCCMYESQDPQQQVSLENKSNNNRFVKVGLFMVFPIQEEECTEMLWTPKVLNEPEENKCCWR